MCSTLWTKKDGLEGVVVHNLRKYDDWMVWESIGDVSQEQMVAPASPDIVF